MKYNENTSEFLETPSDLWNPIRGKRKSPTIVGVEPTTFPLLFASSLLQYSISQFNVVSEAESITMATKCLRDTIAILALTSRIDINVPTRSALVLETLVTNLIKKKTTMFVDSNVSY